MASSRFSNGCVSFDKKSLHRKNARSLNRFGAEPQRSALRAVLFSAALILSFSMFSSHVIADTHGPKNLMADDFRISSMGPNGDTDYGAFWFGFFMMAPDVAYNPVTDQYLVVWFADDNTAPLVDNEFEIFGQLIDATSGAPVGSRIRISFMGPDGSVDYGAVFPSVTYNSTDNEYLVVWVGDHDELQMVNDHFEVFGRRVSAAGQLVESQWRLSYLGPMADPAYGAAWWIGPDVAYSVTDNSYLVVWCGDTSSSPHVNDEFEIWGRRYSADLVPIDATQFEISQMGPISDPNYYASQPAVAWDSTHNNFLVVWEGDHDDFSLANDEVEIFGQLIPGDSTIPFILLNNFQISSMGGANGDPAYDAFDPDVAYNVANDNFLVAWVGDDNQSTTVDEEFEVWGRLVDWDGTLPTLRSRVSGMGQFDGDTALSVFSPAVISVANNYLVVWHGDDDKYGLVDNEFEVFSGVVPADPLQLGLLTNVRLTTMGANADTSRGAFDPALAFDHERNRSLLVWWGDDNVSPSVDDEFEIFGQLLAFPDVFADGFESGSLSSWSSSLP